MADAEEISLEETNKIRASLGLPLLVDDKKTAADNQDEEAEKNYSKVRQKDAKEKADKYVLPSAIIGIVS